MIDQNHKQSDSRSRSAARFKSSEGSGKFFDEVTDQDAFFAVSPDKHIGGESMDVGTNQRRLRRGVPSAAKTQQNSRKAVSTASLSQSRVACGIAPQDRSLAGGGQSGRSSGPRASLCTGRSALPRH